MSTGNSFKAQETSETARKWQILLSSNGKREAQKAGDTHFVRSGCMTLEPTIKLYSGRLVIPTS